MKTLTKQAITVIVVLAVAAGVAFAHSGASGIVKERMESMKSISAAMKTVGNMIRGRSEFDPEGAQEAAIEIEQHAAEIPQLFPEGSVHEPSEALTVIWDDWEQFTAIAIELQENAAALSQEATSALQPSEIASQFAAVAQTCTACHEQFRQ